MAVHEVNDVERLKRINAALIRRVEQSMDQQGSAFTLFQTAINLEGRIRTRTEELHAALRHIEETNFDLVAAKEAAELANQSKTRFLAAASHDVLQPLNAAHLSISALADLQTTDVGHKLALQVQRALETMETLLRTLLDISRFDAGGVQPEYSDVSLDQLFQSVRSDFQPIADKKNLRLRFVSTSATLRTDRTLLLRILQNIVSNAIRYTAKGGVVVGFRRRGDGYRIDVADTGGGIAEDQHDAIFEEFHRGVATHEAALASPGLGLGLAIVRRMGDTLGYPIWLHSRVGKGTIFHIDVPRSSRVAQVPADAAPERVLRRGYGLFGTKVLLIENDQQVSIAMTSLLESWKCDVRVVSSTDQTMAALNDTDWVPDVIIADQHLDDGDLGSDTIEAARNFLGRPVPALLTTADAGDVIDKVAKAGGLEVMRKPLKPAELRALLAHMLA